MSLKHRVAGRISALLHAYPNLTKGEALRQYAHVTLIRDLLEQAMLDGKLDDRRLRALTECQRVAVDLARSMGLVAALPKAGTEPKTARSYRDYQKL